MMIARLRSQPIAIRTLRPDVPDAVEKSHTQALQTNPDHRFTTASELAEALTGSAPSSGSGGGFLGKLKERFS